MFEPTGALAALWVISISSDSNKAASISCPETRVRVILAVASKTTVAAASGLTSTAAFCSRALRASISTE